MNSTLWRFVIFVHLQKHYMNIYTNDYAYIYDFENDYSIDYFTSSNGLVTFGSLGEGNAEIGPNEYVDFVDYGITNLVAGDTISITCEGGMWIAAIQGGYACVEKIHSIEYYPSTIYEVNLIKNIIDDDQIQIGFEDSLMDSLENKYVIRAVQYVKRHFNEDISIGTLAEYLQISEGYLSRVFKKETGYTFTNYVIFYRIAMACELLKDCRMKVYEVTEKVGYSDTAYFSTLFKKMMGMSPTEYQENIQAAPSQSE